MFGNSLSWNIFALTLLEAVIQAQLTVHDGSHGFITGSRKYFDNDLNIIHEEITSGLRSRNSDANLQIKFEPTFLDFKYRPLGVPHLEKVTLYNVDSNKSIDMTSISGSTVHFHSSFFEDKKIPPLGNTSFNVVFLGREEGFVESKLFIHTTEGHFKYNVKGSSIFSPYRLRPIVGIKVPVNTTFSPVIYMHNPHTESLQILEVYSSGGEFHLELPSGELEGPKDIWEIPPLETKAVIRVRFNSKTEKNHTAYVRIKVNATEEILVVPLEVEVSTEGGVFHPQGSVDFGIGGSLDPPKITDLCLFNSFKKPIRIHSIVSSLEAVQVAFDNVKLPAAGKNGCVKVGVVTIDWKTAFKLQEYSGKLTVKYRNGRSKTEISFYLTVLEGGITYDPFSTRYFVNDKLEDLSTRQFKIRNNFQTALRLIDFALAEDAQKYFKIEYFKPLIIKPRQEATIFVVKLKQSVKLAELKLNTYITIKTNISEVAVPVLSYDGRLQVFLPFKSKDYSLDLGLISCDSTKEVYFLVINKNPVGIPLKQVKSSIPMTSASLMGCGKGNFSTALLHTSFKNITKCNSVKPSEYAIVRLTVQTSNAEGQIWGDVQLETPYENLSVPVHFKVAFGKLEIGPDRLVFDQCFPGKICSHPLRVHSTFNDPMIIEEIISLPPDPRLTSKHSGHILARATKVIGHLYLDPTVSCGNECYTGLQHESTAQWLKTLSLPKSVSDFDLNLVNVFYNRYLNSTGNGLKRWQNLTLRLDTSEVRGHIFKTRVKMSWPSLLVDPNHENKNIFTFPLTQIGNVSFKNLTVRNPSSYNLVIQIVLDRNYPDVDLLHEGLPSNFLPGKETHSQTDHFFFVDFEKFNRKFNDDLDVKTHEKTLPVLLEPGENFTFTIGFKSMDTRPNSALLFLRNNLTILEVVRLYGQGAHPMFKFGNRKPGSSQPLTFELTEKHLKDCERDYKSSLPNLSVKRSFTARNIGDVTIHVFDFFINDFECEGYGFKVLNCGPFLLHPNATRKIDIAFTPDLTLSKVTRMLVLHTSLSYPVNYTLFMTIPPYYLNLCANLIVRPPWEWHLNNAASWLMLVVLGFVIFFAFADADKIRKQAVVSLIAPNNLAAQPVLDLRLVGQNARAELRNTKIEEKKINEEKSEKKIETEKYTALIPTIGKSKKKLNKRNSNEGESEKKSNEIQSKKRFVEIKPEEKKPSTVIKKIVPVVKKVTKTPTPVPAYEEETSSTTTDSSSNNDEIDKEVDQRTQKLCSKKTISKNNEILHEEVVVPTVEVKPVVLHHKVERKKSNPKTAVQRNEVKPFEKKQHKPHKDKKEKLHLCKKLSSEKTPKNEKRESPPVRVSPPVSSPLWGENRATFSDVVARNEISIANTRPLSQTQTSKPTMYVEPYKQTSTELGPIGSRRLDFWQEGELPEGQSNSLFSNSYELPQNGGSPNFLGDFSGGGGDAWVQNPNYMGLLEGTENNQMRDSWMQSLVNSSRTMPDFWENFSPASESLPMQQTPPPVSQQSGYLWGSSPVWQPWAPAELPRTPTRTPPGFDTFAQRKQDEMQTQQQQREVYSPFGTSNLWTQQQPNPWNYQGQ